MAFGFRVLPPHPIVTIIVGRNCCNDWREGNFFPLAVSKGEVALVRYVLQNAI